MLYMYGLRVIYKATCLLTIDMSHFFVLTRIVHLGNISDYVLLLAAVILLNILIYSLYKDAFLTNRTRQCMFLLI